MVPMEVSNKQINVIRMLKLNYISDSVISFYRIILIGWDVDEEDLELPADLEPSAAVTTSDDFLA